MARGRKPDSAAQQEAKGNPGRRKTAKPAAGTAAQSKITAGIKQPAWVRKSAKATRIWNDLMPLLARLNLADQLDAFPLHRYCRYAVDWMIADRAITDEGMFVNYTSTVGSERKALHPAWRARGDCETELAKIEASYAMRASDRYRILRDQAAAHGLLPLFGAGADSDENTGEQTDSEAETQNDDAVGALRNFDSIPPGGLPN